MCARPTEPQARRDFNPRLPEEETADTPRESDARERDPDAIRGRDQKDSVSETVDPRHISEKLGEEWTDAPEAEE